MPLLVTRPLAATPGADATIAPLPIPANFTVTALNHTQLYLDWDAVTGASSYTIERDGYIIKVGVTATNYTDSGLEPSTTYYYRVKGVA